MNAAEVFDRIPITLGKPMLKEEYRDVQGKSEKSGGDLGIRLPVIGWSEARLGTLGTKERDVFKKYLDNIGKGGDSAKEIIKNKFNALNKFVQRGPIPGASAGEKLSHLLFIDLFMTLLNEFSAGASGMLTEAFVAAMIDGIQKAGRTIVDIVGPNGEPLSLKVIEPKTPIRGSAANLSVGILASGKGSIDYLIFEKSGTQGNINAIEAYYLPITRENFLRTTTAKVNQKYINLTSEKLFAEIERFVDQNVTPEDSDDEIDRDVSRPPRQERLLQEGYEEKIGRSIAKEFFVKSQLLIKKAEVKRNLPFAVLNLGEKEEYLNNIQSYTASIEKDVKTIYDGVYWLGVYISRYFIDNKTEAVNEASKELDKLKDAVDSVVQGTVE